MSSLLTRIGKILKDEEKLESHNIHSGDSLHLVVKKKPAEAPRPEQPATFTNPSTEAAGAGAGTGMGNFGMGGGMGGGMPGFGMPGMGMGMNEDMLQHAMQSVKYL